MKLRCVPATFLAPQCHLFTPSSAPSETAHVPHHLSISLRRLLQRQRLDHRPHARSGGEVERVLPLGRVAGRVPTTLALWPTIAKLGTSIGSGETPTITSLPRTPSSPTSGGSALPLGTVSRIVLAPSKPVARRPRRRWCARP